MVLIMRAMTESRPFRLQAHTPCPQGAGGRHAAGHRAAASMPPAGWLLAACLLFAVSFRFDLCCANPKASHGVTAGWIVWQLLDIKRHCGGSSMTNPCRWGLAPQKTLLSRWRGFLAPAVVCPETHPPCGSNWDKHSVSAASSLVETESNLKAPKPLLPEPGAWLSAGAAIHVARLPRAVCER